MSFKILKVIFVILLLITLGEAGYYVNILNVQNTKFSLASAKPAMNSNPTSSVISSTSDAIGCVQVLPTVDPSVVGKLVEAAKLPLARAKDNQKLNKDQELVLVFKQKGFVHLYRDTENSRPYIVITNNNKEKIFTLGSGYDDKLFQVSGASKIPIKISDVKEGSVIEDIEYRNVFNSENSVEVLIYDN